MILTSCSSNFKAKSAEEQKGQMTHSSSLRLAGFTPGIAYVDKTSCYFSGYGEKEAGSEMTWMTTRKTNGI